MGTTCVLAVKFSVGFLFDCAACLKNQRSSLFVCVQLIKIFCVGKFLLELKINMQVFLGQIIIKLDLFARNFCNTTNVICYYFENFISLSTKQINYVKHLNLVNYS